MSSDDTNVVTLDSGGGNSTRRTSAGNLIPSPPPGHHLDRQGLRVYDWIFDSLIKDGRKVNAAGIQILLLVHTLQQWSADMSDCIKLGRYGISDGGNRYELPHSYNERSGRSEIKRELPEACLTVMSQIEAKLKESKTGENGQDDLFAELLEHGKARPNGTN